MSKVKKSSEDVFNIASVFFKKNKRYLLRNDLRLIGLSNDVVRHHFTNLTNLNQALVKKYPDIVFDLNASDFKRLPKKRKLVITTAVTGAEVFKPFYNSIKRYCSINNAELVIIPSIGRTTKELIIDNRLKDDVVITSDVPLNGNLSILGVRINANAVDGVTGLPRVGQRNGSFIAASPKQRLKYVATGPSKLPHALMTTGAITLPDYVQTLLPSKNSYIASSDHTMGAIIVELDKNNMFHFRQIQSDSEGKFIDLGKEYSKNRVRNISPEALIPGDWHTGSTCPLTKKSLIKLSDDLKIKTWIMHDMFDGLSVNHHIEHKVSTRAKIFLTLEDELKLFKREIQDLSKNRNLIIVKSNHDDFIDRYLSEAKYVNDPFNYKIAVELANKQMNGENILESYIGKSSKVLFLDRDESYKIADIECGNHGDKGLNGAKGSVNSAENAYGKCVIGHFHTPEINRGVFVVGTSTFMNLGYNIGPSSWLNTACIIYPNGQRQLINFFEGKYKI